jgi:alpha-tubulin suppressor-like RCC1 family protein
MRTIREAGRQGRVLFLGVIGTLLVATITTPVGDAHAQMHASTATLGTLKICKVAGFGVPVGTSFTFDYTTRSGSGTVTVPAGQAPGGYCVVAGTADGAYEITEVIPAGDGVSAITAVPAAGTADRQAGTFRGRLTAGTVTEVTYTDQETGGAPTGYLEICKQLEPSSATPPGVFVFNVNGLTVDVPPDACSAATEVRAGVETVTETSAPPFQMTGCSTTPAADEVSCDPSEATAMVNVSAGGVPAETVLTVSNGTGEEDGRLGAAARAPSSHSDRRRRQTSPPRTGTLKVCKVAGFGVSVGTAVTFADTTRSGTGSVTVPAGPAPGGYCVVVGTVDVGRYRISEMVPDGDTVTAITAVPPGGRTSRATGTFSGTVRAAQVTEVTFTDQSVPAGSRTGYLEICKQVVTSPAEAPPSAFSFSVDGQTVDVPAGACSPAIEVLAGTATITENGQTPPYQLMGCTTIPTPRLQSCFAGGTATVAVHAGAVSSETVLTVTDGGTLPDVPLPAGVKSMASDGGNAGDCAVLTTGHVYCWGYNLEGELGDGTTTTAFYAPVAVTGITTAMSITSDTSGYCALLTSKRIECWGDNTYGELGDGTSTGPSNCGGSPCSKTPVPVIGITNAVNVTGGTSSAQDGSGPNNYCAVLTTGAIDCWGGNGNGGLGIGNSTGPSICHGAPCSTTPVTVSGIANASSIVSAESTSWCAILTTATVDCWGANIYGELGIGTTVDSSVPVTVSGLSGVVSIVSDGWGYCVLLSSGVVDCWGGNLFGELGVGTTTGPNTCYLSQPCSTSPVTPSAISHAVSLILAYRSYCVVLTSGAVECWGDNRLGQLGDGTSTGPTICASGVPCSPVPVTVTGISNAVSVDGSGSGDCAVLMTGSVSCWGANGAGELGDGTTTNSSIPVGVIGVATAATVIGDGNSFCAVLTSQALVCWAFLF